jgi:hypothetical protein
MAAFQSIAVIRPGFLGKPHYERLLSSIAVIQSIEILEPRTAANGQKRSFKKDPDLGQPAVALGRYRRSLGDSDQSR